MDSSNLYASNRRFTADLEDKFRPRTVTLVKDKSGFGFTLRHFIVYPPTSLNSDEAKQENDETPIESAQWKSEYKSKPMDTIFIREVKEGSPAHNAGLNKGDRIIAINNHPLTGKSYSDIIHLILKSGLTLRLLVVPKEDDILQLYFATSAYQPVHRERKQHKYLVPSFHTTADQSNNLYRQSAYGTYPGRLHKNSTPIHQITEDRNLSPRFQLPDSNVSCRPHTDPSLLASLHSNQLEDKKFDLPLQSENQIFQGGCFSEDEGHYNHEKDLTNNDCLLQPPKLKDTVANFYYQLCNDQSSSVFSFTSEGNLNYPIYMSDFDDVVHCDNKMEDAGNMMEALQMESNAHPSRFLYDCQRANYVDDSQPGESCVCMSDSQTSFRTENRMGNSTELNPPFLSGQLNSQSSLIHNKPSDSNNMLPSDCDLAGNDDALSINLVAQRRHQFESGNLLAESLERMNMYRSELSRMSKPNQVRIVSTRAAQFENKCQKSPTYSHKEEVISKDLMLTESENYVQEDPIKPISDECDFNSDHQNQNQIKSEEPSLSFDSDSAQIETMSGSSDYAPVVPGVVHRRKTVPGSADPDECHIVRRISYLRATAGDRMNVESDLSEEDISDASSPNKDFRIQKLKSFFGEKTPKVKQALQPEETVSREEEPKSVYGWVICKVVSLEGKRSSDRSWRHLWAVLRSNILYLLKERREPSKAGEEEHVINVKYSIAKAATDYVKRKHVLRLLLLNGTEYLVQTESHASMTEWLAALQSFAAEIAELPDWLKNTSVLEKAAAYEQQIQKHHRKHPNVKTRRASQGDELALTKIGVLWRDRMVQGWKRVHGSHAPKSFGVRLESAPPGLSNEHVPLLVELCVQVVERCGLDVVGIYRVPGNNASVSVLTDRVNQGVDEAVLQDGRWNDVNIVSSLLKAFFRKLPEPLLTSALYPKFIQASKTDDPLARLKAIKHVLYHLPVHYFATLKYLMYHLKKVVEHSPTNKMEARNLAIVFGPTLVRTTDNNMVTMVTDMSHQCYLIETLITYAEWLFEDSGEILPLEMNDKRKTHPPSNMQSSALLTNINKLDGLHEDSLPHEMFTSLYHTAARHLRHRHKKKDAAKRAGIIGSCKQEVVLHRYDDLSAQEKIRNFEKETKALLRRDKPRASVGSPQVEWEQIEREWQKAKRELEQEDLLDHLADDPSYLSCLLNRGSPDDKNDYPLSSSCVKDFLFTPRNELQSSSEFLSSSYQSDKSVLKEDKCSLGTALRTKNDKSEIPTSVSQPALSASLGERTLEAKNHDFSNSYAPKLIVSASSTVLAPTVSPNSNDQDQPKLDIPESAGPNSS